MGKILPVIMCGGAGTRVWPESRESLPKQFIALVGERSTFQNLLAILRDSAAFDAPIVITNHDYRFRVGEQMQEMAVSGEIVLEPMRRDSGPAVAVAAEMALRRAPGTVVAVLASDHAIANPQEFAAKCIEAAAAARAGAIVTFGIKPSHPATGYGYIRPGHPLGGMSDVRKIDAFVEKPGAERAQAYLAEGYLWNSGNFFFRADVMKNEIAKFEPMMASAAQAAVEGARRDLDFLLLDAGAFEKAPKKSIDFAVMERTGEAAVLAADFGWSDVGDWAAVHDLSPRDLDGNSIRGHGVVMDSHNVHIRADDQLTAVVGLDDVVVVTTQDAVLVVHRSQTARVKQLVEKLKKLGRKEATEHKRMYRPWGYYQAIDSGARYQVKRIVVKPGGRLSLQKHFHRAEHWVVVRGTAEVTRNADVLLVHENESVYLPIGCTHRMVNPGKINLELIEVQVGSYTGEDDIVRIEDVYNRS